MSKCYSTDGNVFYCDSEDDVLDILESDVNNVYYSGTPVKIIPSELFCIDSLLESMQERAFDLVDDIADRFLDDITADVRRKVELSIEKVLDEKISCNFFAVKDVKEHVVKREPDGKIIR